MGAESFIREIKGSNPGICFESLVDEADMEYGTSSYNGSINTCSMGRKTLSLNKLSEANVDKAYSFIEKNDNGNKWEASYIEIGPIAYNVYTFKKKHTGEKPKYELKYVVKEGYISDRVIKGFKTKKEADDYAISLSVKNSEKVYFVSKEYVLVNGKSVTTEIEKITKTYKSKPNLKPMPNRVIEPEYLYIFYGWASC